MNQYLSSCLNNFAADDGLFSVHWWWRAHCQHRASLFLPIFAFNSTSYYVYLVRILDLPASFSPQVPDHGINEPKQLFGFQELSDAIVKTHRQTEQWMTFFTPKTQKTTVYKTLGDHQYGHPRTHIKTGFIRRRKFLLFLHLRTRYSRCVFGSLLHASALTRFKLFISAFLQMAVNSFDDVVFLLVKTAFIRHAVATDIFRIEFRE